MKYFRPQTTSYVAINLEINYSDASDKIQPWLMYLIRYFKIWIKLDHKNNTIASFFVKHRKCWNFSGLGLLTNLEILTNLKGLCVQEVVVQI
jgi:hypothetical protein